MAEDKTDYAVIRGFLCVTQSDPGGAIETPVMIGLGSISLVRSRGAGWTEVFVTNDRMPINVKEPFAHVRKMIREASE
jgi:hypothetical protein